MDKNVYEIVGIRRVENKAKKTYTLIDYLRPYTDYETGSSQQVLGMATGSEFTYKEFPDLKIGDRCKFYYTKGYEDKAVLDDIVVVPFNKK